MRKFIVFLVLIIASSVMSVQSQSGRQVWAFYMGFWVGEASWQMQADVLTDRPAIGNYDSRDGGVAATHIDQARSAGIDAFVVSWYGLEDGAVTTAVLNNLLDRAAERGFMVGAVVDIFSSQFNRSPDALINSLNYLVYDRANHPAYLRYNGKPVILFAFQNRANFSRAQWQQIRSAVDPNRSTIWIAEGVNGCCLYGGAMDGMYAFNIAWANGSGGRYVRERNAVRSAGGTIYVPTVHPGWDEQLIARRERRPNPTSPRDRAGGRFLANSFAGAVSAGTDVILIGTWNEFIENSHIEPSVNFGSQSLDVLRPLIADWKAGGGGSAGGGGAAPASACPASPTGQVLSATNSTVNVRPTPSTDGAPIGRIRPRECYAVLGSENGWFLIDFNGRQGWVNGSVVTVRGQ
ncbi:endo-1,3-alpha-glucanase family glycosylhydrolase [Aggregatilineales bacterium SYSU G02658]